MATVKVVQPRIQEAHFGLYRTSAGGDESIVVRRKIADPTDYKHTKSRKLHRQREAFSQASHHYSQLTPTQKAITRHQFEEVEYQQSHGKTDTKLLTGRQLFISKEIRSLNVTQKRLVLPYELCIMLVDENQAPLEGELWLRYLKDGEWKDIGKEELAEGSWLFSQTPREQEAYRPYGKAPNYYDPELPEHQNMTEAEILAYHYHVLNSKLVKMCHSLPHALTAIDTIAGYRFSQPFIPCYDFTLKELHFTLRHHYNPSFHPLTTGFISIYETDANNLPTSYPLATDSFSISVPAYPEWQIHKATFSPLALTQDTLYAWVIGFRLQAPEGGRIEVRRGELGTCNPSPFERTYFSYYQEGHWTPWYAFEIAQLHYEMKAPPP